MSSRRPIIVGNWKLHKTPEETRAFFLAVRHHLGTCEDRDAGICPPAYNLHPALEASQGAALSVGAQNCSWSDHGALTGELSPAVLKEMGCKYVIVGHSERRQLFHETDADIGRRLKAALSAGLEAIFCVGETLEERDAGRAFETVRTQLEAGLSELEKGHFERLLLAYEPVWAIGTGRNATPEQAQEIHAYLRDRLLTLYGKKLTQGVRILYGGSVKPENIASLMAGADVDGALAGGASLNPESFLALVHFDTAASAHKG